ncbi:MAG: ribonuclease E/G, partial [Kiritimatiellia bacterium]|nr:ribonuclease E/G [Kiritimatiellia bacterium]
SQEEAILQVNLEAADEIARQIRLRNIGGLLVLDFIDMKSRKDQNTVYRKMREGLRRDKARTNVLPISDLGLMEMTRQRVAESLRSAIFMDCPYCDGRGKVKSAFSMSVEIQRHLAEVMKRRNKNGEALRITVNPAILERLRKEDEEVLVQMEKTHGTRLVFVSDPGRHLEEFVISDPTTGQELYASRDREDRPATS